MPGTRKTALLAGGALIATVLSALPARGLAQSLGDPGAPSSQTAPSGELRIFVGMWTAHLRHLGRGFDNNWLLGIGWRGFYGGTFVNSYGDRAFAAGIQRSLARARDGTVIPAVGYRLSMVTGYDGRLLSIAAKTPVIPVIQILGDVRVGPTGIELAWAGPVASLGPSVRF